MRTVTELSGRSGARRLLNRVIGIADKPTDDDDLHLRKRVMVVAGYILVIAPLQLPVLAQGLPLSWIVAVAMPIVSGLNLIVLARSHRFERYVNVLIVMVLAFPAVIEIALGGLAGSRCLAAWSRTCSSPASCPC